MKTENLLEEELEEPPSLSSRFCKDNIVDLHRYNSRTQDTTFRQRFFPQASDRDWQNWRWQLRNRITSGSQLEKIIRLSDDERLALAGRKSALPLSITPYYASLLDPENPAQPIRRTIVPTTAELIHSPGESADPLDEEGDSPAPGLVHRYPDRALFLVTDFCSNYCRYCTRSRLVGRDRQARYNMAHWQQALAYIEATPTIRDVLLSGGDPLTLPDDKLDWLLKNLRRIPHVEMIRIGTKVPVVLPQRITPALVRILRRYHPLWISIHCTHPDEQTPEMTAACNRLADAGIPLGSQTVLLSGINDSVATMTRLVQGLLKMRVRPYYLYQCDPIIGSAHFRTPVSKGLEIYQGLRGHTSGYAVPNYVIDAPGGGGKIPLLPETVIGRDNDEILLKNYQGKIFRYPDNIATITEPRN